MTRESASTDPTGAASSPSEPAGQAGPADPALAELLRQRYGAAPTPELPADLPPAVARLLAHRSVRRFTSAPVSDRQLAAAVAAAQSASTSSSLQLWTAVHITDPDLRRRLRPLCGGQEMLEQAPVLLFWIADPTRDARVSQQHGGTDATAVYLETTLTAVIDAALAAQAAAAAAELQGLGVCYVGGARNHPAATAELLGLPTGAFAVFGMVMGWPDPAEDAGIRPRLPLSTVLHENRYRLEPASPVAGMDAAQRDYFARRGRDHGWVDAVTRRLTDVATLYGREGLRAELESLSVGLR
jgi:nitroreductase